MVTFNVICIHSSFSINYLKPFNFFKAFKTLPFVEVDPNNYFEFKIPDASLKSAKTPNSEKRFHKLL